MFKIDGEKLKRTYCDTPKILTLVFADYQKRGFDGLVIDTVDDDTLTLDFGGCALTTEKPVRVGRLQFLPHQAHLVLSTLEDAEDRGGYVKLHGQHYCLCVSPETANECLSQLRKELPGVERLAEAQFNEWKNRHGKKG
jgi:hypothetical protein